MATVSERKRGKVERTLGRGWVELPKKKTGAGRTYFSGVIPDWPRIGRLAAHEKIDRKFCGKGSACCIGGSIRKSIIAAVEVAAP